MLNSIKHNQPVFSFFDLQCHIPVTYICILLSLLTTDTRTVCTHTESCQMRIRSSLSRWVDSFTKASIILYQNLLNYDGYRLISINSIYMDVCLYECEDKGLLISELNVGMQLILMPHLHLYFKTHIGYIRPLACGIIFHLAMLRTRQLHFGFSSN